MTDELKAALFGLWTLACLTGGWLLSDHWNRQTVAAATAHAQQVLGNGNVLAAREAPQPDMQLQTALPPGDKPVAAAHIVIAARQPVYVDDPKSPHKAAHKPPIDCADYVSHLTCPAVAVDETLVKDKTGQLDLVVKGADQATLTPIAPTLIQPDHPWAAGISYDNGHRLGAFVDRDAGPLRLGAEINQAQQTGLEARLKLGWRF